MTNEQIKVILGALLHDIGKVIYKSKNENSKHSILGYEFLKKEVGFQDDSVLNCVKYHHDTSLENADIANTDIAYIVNIANNIASSVGSSDEPKDTDFEISSPLQSVFNIINGNSENKVYLPQTLDIGRSINYPTDNLTRFDESFYSKVKLDLINNLKGIKYTEDYINSLLSLIENDFSYYPASNGELMDISLYDHLKVTAAIASCYFEYASENNIDDYKEAFYVNSEKMYSTNTFLLYSMDVSGIQDFIYTITSKEALKTLRARSFYLEIMMEHIIDELLERLELSRANLIYVGGGHCYLLIPNTKKTLEIVKDFGDSVNSWMLDTYKTSLYIATGYSECSSNSLLNNPSGSYEEIYKNISAMIYKAKSSRYSPSIIRMLNKSDKDIRNRECKICKRTDNLNSDDECSICSSIKAFSKNILYDEIFVVTHQKNDKSVPLPLGAFLSSVSENEITKTMEDENYVRSYSKNTIISDKRISTKLWVGNYTTGKTFREMAKEAEGIDRIGVLRADVDNLGQAFVSGFSNKDNDDKYVSLSRTATFSRQLSLFFKSYINYILENPIYTINGKPKKHRNATICYSGGDDLFIVGAWDDIIELAIDIRNGFKRYSQGTLTLSAGIGVYDESYPISVIANEVAELEEKSKGVIGKDAITLFEDGEHHIEEDELGNTSRISDGTYKWDELINDVLGEKYSLLDEFFDEGNERGKNFLYNLLELIRNKKESINFARYVYLLSRLEPAALEGRDRLNKYKHFSKKMYEWMNNDKDSIQLKTAINMYAYMEREVEK